jgi:hypothetical protein
MNVSDAAYATVHDYPGGAISLAPRVGMNPTVLNSKVNQNTTTHHLTMLEAQRIMGVTGDHRILRAQCEDLGYLPPIPRVEAGVSDAALLETYTRLMSELGDFSGKFHKALSDGKLTSKEVDGLQVEMLEFFAAGEELLNRARQIAEG